MPDLKAAAKRLDELNMNLGDCILAAQALEAWAWQQERGVSVEECSGKLDRPYGKYRVMGYDSAGRLKRYYADTPLGVVLAAIEGELGEHTTSPQTNQI